MVVGVSYGDIDGGPYFLFSFPFFSSLFFEKCHSTEFIEQLVRLQCLSDVVLYWKSTMKTLFKEETRHALLSILYMVYQTTFTELSRRNKELLLN